MASITAGVDRNEEITSLSTYILRYHKPTVIFFVLTSHL